MKKIFFNVTAFICAGLLFAGCNKEGEDDVNSSGGSGFDGVIQATAVSLYPWVKADEVDIDEVKAIIPLVKGGYYHGDYVVATGSYDKGRFILNLPLIIPDEYIQYLLPITDGLSGGVKVSDTNAKSFPESDIYAYKGKNQVGDLVYGSSDDKSCEYRYVDRDVNITGSYSEIDDGMTRNRKYNLSLKKGWNKVYHKESNDRANNTKSHEYTSTELSGLTWHLDYWGN